MRFQTISQKSLELPDTKHNRVVLNQVLVRAQTDGETDGETRSILKAVQASVEVWFGATVWKGRPAFRISISSWRTPSCDAEIV